MPNAEHGTTDKLAGKGTRMDHHACICFCVKVDDSVHTRFGVHFKFGKSGHHCCLINFPKSVFVENQPLELLED